MDLGHVHPDLRARTRRIPSSDVSRPVVRAMTRLATRVMPVPRIPGVQVRTTRARGVRLRVYRPQTVRRTGALFWVHGGGLLFGDARQDEALCAHTARELGIPVVSGNYRVAPGNPFPAALDDVRIGWGWALEHARELGVRSGDFAVGGESAGGGLAAALAQQLLDEGGIQPRAQWLFAPMLDDRTAADRSLDAVGHWIWDNRSNRVGWSGYLPGTMGTDEVPRYATAARREDLTGLPPAYLAVGDIELFRAEVEQYAARLDQAGVPVVLDLVPGAPHGFENWARGTPPAQKLLRRARDWLAARL